jgi:hypothetical protein
MRFNESMPENPLLRRRIAEIGGKLAAARTTRDELYASPPTTERDEQLKVSVREMALLSDRMNALVARLISSAPEGAARFHEVT